MDTLFEIEPVKNFKVLSASRMTDMPKFYPKELIDEVEKRKQNGITIHTLVLWTKHPKSLLREPLYSYLNNLKKDDTQLYIQLTITGLGKEIIGKKPDGSPLIIEPNTPKYEDAISLLPKIIELVEKPERIRLRIDPIIRIKKFQGNSFSSLKYFPLIIEKVRLLGIKTISFSFLEKDVHKKVDNQLKNAGCVIIPPSEEERIKTTTWLKELESKYDVNIFSCSVPGMKISKCIDGELLEELHDKKYPTSLKQQLKRKLCGCSESIDIGGWPPKKCFSGCIYCYANAVIKD